MAKAKVIQNAQGQFGCPLCSRGQLFVPLKPCRGKLAGKAWGCTNNAWSKERGTYNPTGTGPACDFLHWVTSYQRKETIQRPASWPNIAKRTPEQNALRNALAVAPGTLINGVPVTRLKIVNAVPGSGKSTSMADDAQVIFARVGPDGVQQWHIAAFNTNARDSLESKLPPDWPNISTINGMFGRLQGFNSRNYKPGKISTIFSELVKPLPRKERPSSAGLKAFAERIRDLLWYTDSTADKSFWNEAIQATAIRFGALAKVLEKNSETISAYLPEVLTRCMADRSVIDLTEQYARPVLEAIRATGWKQRAECCERLYEWTNDDLEHLCKLIRAVKVPQCAGVIVDEAQDLSLSQIVVFLATTYRAGELVLVGDDKADEPYKAGQAIFGWRGAFAGSLGFVARLWEMLTSEQASYYPLSVSFRCPPEICDALQGLNTVMVSAKPRGTGEVLSVGPQQAFARWLDTPDLNSEGKPFAALWITRRNAPLAPIFMATLKERKQVCLRGGGDMAAQIDGVLGEAAGWYDDAGEYRVSLSDCLAKLRAMLAEQAADAGAEVVDSMESFLLEVGESLEEDPTLLRLADLSAEATVGNLRKFVLFFANKNAPRVLSTVYRSKGDEADLVIVDDCEALNSAWNNDTDESAAVRHVACSRSRQSLLIVGALAGVSVSGSVPAPPPVAPATVKAATVAPATVAPATVAPLALDFGEPAPTPKKTRAPRKKPAPGTLFN